MKTSKANSSHLLIAAAAAFATYFCMYAFRKPFTAATFEGLEVWASPLKGVLISSQLAGYMLSKFIGIKVISEMRSERRAVVLVGLIVVAELALVGFAFAPTPFKVVFMFLNGLPLGMVFGLVLSYLEGRRQTEALSAALCASFIVSSGVVKSVGRWLTVEMGVSEFLMPMLTGLIFFVPLLAAVWVLQATPPPDYSDRLARHERTTMNRAGRLRFIAAYWPGLSMLLLVYVAMTVIRMIRDDYGVEIWRDLGADSKTTAIFAQSETIVGVCVFAVSALAILIRNHLTALRLTVGLMFAAFALTGSAALLQRENVLGPLAFMVTCGVGLYIPYVAFHTTVFERFIAAAKLPCNLGFLIYLADSVGYLGFLMVIWLGIPKAVLPYFSASLLAAAGLSIVSLLLAAVYFEKALARKPPVTLMETAGNIAEELAAAKT